MAKPELGTKRICVACAARYYDMTKSPAICPKCAVEQPIEVPRPRRVVGNVTGVKRPTKTTPIPGAEDVDIEMEGVEDSEEDVMEDTSNLEDDADAIGPEIEVPPDNDEER